jgi:hypothetical protein
MGALFGHLSVLMHKEEDSYRPYEHRNKGAAFQKNQSLGQGTRPRGRESHRYGRQHKRDECHLEHHSRSYLKKDRELLRQNIIRLNLE